MLYFVLVLMIIFAFLAIQSDSIMRAIVLLSAFSVLCSIAYFMLHAPDVAIAEAVIGCSLSTILFLVALRKYRIFTVYVLVDDQTSEAWKFKIKRHVIKFVKTINLEVHYIVTNEPLERLIEKYKFDSIMICDNNAIDFHGYKSNYHFDLMYDYFNKQGDYHAGISYIDQDEMEEI